MISSYLSVCNYRHFHNVYSGNETTRFTITCTLGTSLLTVSAADMVIFIAPLPQLQEGYEGGTDDSRAREDCTVDEPDFITSYQGKAEV